MGAGALGVVAIGLGAVVGNATSVGVGRVAGDVASAEVGSKVGNATSTGVFVGISGMRVGSAGLGAATGSQATKSRAASKSKP